MTYLSAVRFTTFAEAPALPLVNVCTLVSVVATPAASLAVIVKVIDAEVSAFAIPLATPKLLVVLLTPLKFVVVTLFPLATVILEAEAATLNVFAPLVAYVRGVLP